MSHPFNFFNNTLYTDYDLPEDAEFPGYCADCNREIWRHYPIGADDIELCESCEEARMDAEEGMANAA